MAIGLQSPLPTACCHPNDRSMAVVGGLQLLQQPDGRRAVLTLIARGQFPLF